MAIEVRFVADGVEQEGWTLLTGPPGETNNQAFGRKQASHEAKGWTVVRQGQNMTATKDYPQNAGTPHFKRKERFFRVRP